MFATTSPKPIDELEVDQSSYDEGLDDGIDDDATEFSQRSWQPYNILPPYKGSSVSGPGGTIRMEGWLNHTTSSYKDNNATQHQSNNNDVTNTAPPASTTTQSIISKTISTKKKKKARQNSKKQRYFVLRNTTLSYYARRHDVKAKGTFVLTKGCSVGPVVYASLDESLIEIGGNATITTAGQQQEPLSPTTRDNNAAATGTDSTTNTNTKSSKKQKKQENQLYCIQITWPTNDQPTKDEKFMAQAKAQVAAESEKAEALQQQQLELDNSFDTDRLGDGRENFRGSDGGTKSPLAKPKQLMRRSKSDSTRSPRKAVAVVAGLGGSSNSNDSDLPPEMSVPNLNTGDDHRDDFYDENTQNGRNEIPRPRLPNHTTSSSLSGAAFNTPAMALSGSNAFDAAKATAASGRAAAATDTNGEKQINHETGLHKHYKHQIEKHTRDQQKSAEELLKVRQLLSRKESHQRTKKRVIQGTKVAAVSTAAITAGILTAGIGLAAGLVFVGITAAAGGSGAVVGSKVLDKARGKYYQHQKQKSFHLIIGCGTYEEAMRWKRAMELVIKELVDDDDIENDELVRITQTLSSGEEGAGIDAIPSIGLQAPLSPPTSPKNTSEGVMNNDIVMYHNDMTPKWVPIQGGGMALWGILGALGGGGGNLRIYREERCGMSIPYSLQQQQQQILPAIPRLPRIDVGLAGQPFPPFKASVSLKANSLDAFMCLMCSGRIHNYDGRANLGTTNPDRIPVPNSGQIASFRIIETIDDHMDVIHLVFRPLYLFPSWTAPRDFVLYRFWKYDDDGTYQICFDSGEHRDCPAVPGYVRGNMHSVYTIAPLKRKKKKRGGSVPNAAVNASDASTAGVDSATARPNLMKEECLLSHVVQVDPRGWVPTTSSLPFVRNQGYGDAFAIMALLQMLDVKEALDTSRFVAVPMDGTQNSTTVVQSRGFKPPRRLLGSRASGTTSTSNRAGNRLVRNTSGTSTVRAGNVRSPQQEIFMPTLATSESGDISEDEADYDYRTGSGPRDSSSKNDKGAMDLSFISSNPPPTISNWWAEPDANSFRVRGKTYKTDNKKVNAGPSLFHLFATDIIETDEPIHTGMCLHPKERVQLALQREQDKAGDDLSSPIEMPPFVFAVNIIMPGPPNYHMVFYYAVDDMSLIDGSDGTPSSKLCQEFFFGKDDTFRDNTFKLIPHIVEGNFMVRKAVGSTPAIMGNKIKQTYIQGERFFELMIDTGSSSVAAGVIRICNGYAKMIVVDLAFLFEGYNEQTLPESVLGTIRLKNVEFGKKLRFVESVD